MTEEEYKRRYFEQYPVGTELLSEHYFGIHRVTGWLVSTWSYSERPWYALACEHVMGESRAHPETDERIAELESRLIEGSLPEDKNNLRLHVLNGSGSRSFFRLGEVKAVFNHYTTFFTWGSYGHWMVLQEDYGDSSVGMGGNFSDVFAGHHGMYCLGEYYWDCEDEHPEELKYLMDVAFYLKRKKEKGGPFRRKCVLVDRENKKAYRAEIEHSANEDLRCVWRRNFRLHPYSITSLGFLQGAWNED
jgi:hypothetical protein